MERFKFTKKEVAKILNKGESTLRKWSNEKISEELLKSCYELVEISKEGRNVCYYCNYKEHTMDSNEYLKGEFNIMDIDNFKDYTKVKFNSIETETLEPRKEIAKKSNTCYETARNYDRKLKDKGVISTEGYLYICMEKSTGKRVLVDENAYKNFWFKHSETKKELGNLKQRYKKSELTINQYNHLRDVLIFSNNSEHMYSKVEKSIIKYDNVLYKMLMENLEDSPKKITE